MTSAMRPGVAMQRSCREGGSGAMTGLATGSSMRTYLPRTSWMRIELGGLEVELLAHFLADAAEGFGIEQDFGRIEFFALDG